MATSAKLNLVEASIADLQKALTMRAISSVELVSLYLRRIGRYDCRGPRLNSVVVLNPRVFEEAQASDDYRALGNKPRPLEGIPFTVKDSFRVKGLTVAAGSPAFADLISSSDATIVALLRAAGGIVLGKTNMPPMADGGSQRGLYGRSESPYNPTYMSTAYASGSSNGCGVATAANLASFGFAGESVSSGRSPASNNALVAYTSSRSMIPIRGQWPLYPTCDLVVPHTKSMGDLFDVLNVVVADDPKGVEQDFWRSQEWLRLPLASHIRPKDYHALANPDALRGKRIAVPRCFIGKPSIAPLHECSAGVRSLWDRARSDLESLGAVIVETDFPLLEKYSRQDFPGQSVNVPGLTKEWATLERCHLIAFSWDEFLRTNGDEKYPSLIAADPSKIHPHVAPMDDPTQFTETQNHVRYEDMFEVVRRRRGGLTDLPGCREALLALETMRQKDFEGWMDEHDYHAVVFPTHGDVALADADENYDSMLHALRDGVKYANGGRALKHLGIPCITVPMGTLEQKRMPVGISFCGRAYQDSDLLAYAFAYESLTQRRDSPPLAPPLPSDEISLIQPDSSTPFTVKPVLKVESIEVAKEDAGSDYECRLVSASGTLTSSSTAPIELSLDIFTNGDVSCPVTWEGRRWTWSGRLSQPKIAERYPTLTTVPRDQFMLMFIGKAGNKRASGLMHLV
ncbi:glu asp-trna amidotransferase subunit a [Diaporthe amygdali]|uniref:glu asp-trna amidotransferase subunit a n=1 Tax=Phomopsis amygdali TaxID=1214568 RepID=UPI0022FE45C1|nr:glu asp-trna amidotransferase subunit a [Diaporthe amygdali]KAJ0114222.1 glu asp-trna amidotransferase subunit a [Diaporthe amygdali]